MEELLVVLGRHCNPSDKVLVDKILHIYKSEKVVFDKSIGQLTPVFYRLNEKNKPDIHHLRQLMKENNIKLLCIENTHNFSGGVCIGIGELEEIHNISNIIAVNRPLKPPIKNSGE